MRGGSDQVLTRGFNLALAATPLRQGQGPARQVQAEGPAVAFQS